MLNLRQEIPTLLDLKEEMAEIVLEKYNEKAYLIKTCASAKGEYDLKELKSLIFMRETFCFCDIEFDFENNMDQISKSY